MTLGRGTRLNELSKKVIGVCSNTPQSLGEILARLPGEDKAKVSHRVHQMVTQGFLQNHRSVRSYGGLFSLPSEKVEPKREIQQPKLTTATRFALYDVWR